jgi:LacI family transcriptional regulator, galactose operon repressor
LAIHRRPTSADVARLAGVSRTTVSFVLNKHPTAQISQATRERVLAAALELGYFPLTSTRRAPAGASMVLGLVLRQRAEQVAVDALLPETLRGLSAAARESGFRILVEPIPPGDQTYATLLRTHQVDGLVISGPRADDAALAELQAEGFPVVLQGSLPGASIPGVDIDNAHGARLAVEHLLAAGHREVACITNGPLAYTAAQERLAGYRVALETADIAYDDRFVAHADFDAASGHAAMDRLLRRGCQFTAVFAASDVVALGVIGAARAHRIRVPQELAVVGFDDIPLSSHFDPPLTTIHLPAYELGYSVGRALIDRIAGRPVPVRSVLETQLVVRGSTPGPHGGEAGGLAPAKLSPGRAGPV